MKFYVIHLKSQGEKFDRSATLYFLVDNRYLMIFVSRDLEGRDEVFFK